MEIALTKRDVARRQLATAIHLLFERADSISAYSLASNAWEVIDVLCNTAKVASISNQTREHLPQGKNLKHDYINHPYRNFFKHADRDPDAVLPKFEERNLDSTIFLAVEDYIRLYKKSPIEFQVFQLWYLGTNPDKLALEQLDRVMHGINQMFPGIGKLDRVAQILMGKQVLAAASIDEQLQSDVATEPAF